MMVAVETERWLEAVLSSTKRVFLKMFEVILKKTIAGTNIVLSMIGYLIVIRLHSDWFGVQSRTDACLLYNKRACPTKKEPQQGFLYLTIKMSSSEKFKSNAKTSTSTGILFLFYYFLIKSYLKELLRMSGSYKRFKKLKASKELTQVVTTKPDF